MNRSVALVPVAALLTVLAGLPRPTQADTIYRTNGKKIEDVTIVEESLAEISYKDGNKKDAVKTEDVLAVEYDKKPRLVDEADATVAEDVPFAIQLFDQYVDGQIAGGLTERKKWAPAYAAFRAVELNMVLADLDGVARASDRLIQNFPDSRFLPSAYLAKARAQLTGGDTKASLQTLGNLERLIESKSLSRRWQLECKLAQIRADTQMAGDARRERLAEIAGEAGTQFPTVRNIALVAEGETYLHEAEVLSDKGSARFDEYVESAREVFERIVKDPQADFETLAGAHTGLGEALFLAATKSKDKELFDRARMHFLRVPILFPEQSRYIPKSLFYAMRCFQLTDSPEGEQRARLMKRELKGRYPSSPWASKADKF